MIIADVNKYLLNIFCINFFIGTNQSIKKKIKILIEFLFWY